MLHNQPLKYKTISHAYIHKQLGKKPCRDKYWHNLVVLGYIIYRTSNTKVGTILTYVFILCWLYVLEHWK